MKEIIHQRLAEEQLPEVITQIAKSELCEDHYSRKQCLEQLRNWLNKNDDIINMRTDDNFLLRFLRFNKFSVSLAKQTILKYLNIRRTFPHLTTELDCLNSKLNGLISAGYIFASPKRNKHEQRVIIMNARCLNPKLYGCIEQAKVHFLTYECLMEDPLNQIAGLVHIIDLKGVTTQHITNWNPMEFARIFKWGEQSLPLRHKEIHVINAPSTLKWLIDTVKNRLSTKIRNRVKTYANEKDLHNIVSLDCLPLELGGHIPADNMVRLWKQELLAKRSQILNLDRIQLLSDRGILRKSSYNSDKTNSTTNYVPQIEYIEGNFRKLEFD